MDDKLRKKLGLDIYDKLFPEYLNDKFIPEYLKFLEKQEQIERSNRVYNQTMAILNKVDNNNFISGITKVNQALSSIPHIKSTVLQNTSSFQSFLNTTATISESLNSKYTNSDLFAKRNLFNLWNEEENKKLKSIDILSGITFTKLFNSHINENTSLEDELDNLNNEYINSPEIRKEVGVLMAKIKKEPARNYQKIEEYLTDFIDKIAIKIGLSKQHANYIAVIIIFLSGAYVKDVLFTKESQPTLNITNNIHHNYFNKPKQLAYTTKQAPVYEKNHSTSRKVGTIKEDSEIEILRMKQGWCLIKGTITIRKKIGKIKTDADSLIQCWISQKYLSDFQ